MSVQTNTVHVVSPPETDLEATALVFERFGKVAAVDVLADDASRVSVVFFDVRSAARAVEALGSSYCTPGPQSGPRSVFMAAEAQFRDEDISGISDCSYDADNGRYVIEFYDIRDAAKYSAEVAMKEVAEAGPDSVAPPPGLALPPGLPEPAAAPKAHGEEPAGSPGLGAVMPPPPGLPAPPGLEDEAAKQPSATDAGENARCAMRDSDESVCRVSLTGLPNKLLNDLMMEAVLQQAGLDSCAVGISLRSGKPVGEAIISFSSELAASHCIAHFTGCQWDQSGKGVTARILPSEEEKQTSKQASKKAAVGTMSAKAPAWEPPSWQMDQVLPSPGLGFEHLAVDMASSLLSADVPEFMQCVQDENTLFAPSKKLSAKAPEFVPTKRPAEEVQNQDFLTASAAQALVEHIGVSSDTSTEVGESEAEEDKGSPQMLLGQHMQQLRSSWQN